MTMACSYFWGYTGIGNFWFLQHLRKFYPEGVELLNQMEGKTTIPTSKDICKELTNSDFDTHINVALSLVLYGKMHWK